MENLISVQLCVCFLFFARVGGIYIQNYSLSQSRPAQKERALLSDWTCHTVCFKTPVALKKLGLNCVAIRNLTICNFLLCISGRAFYNF